MQECEMSESEHSGHIMGEKRVRSINPLKPEIVHYIRNLM